MTKPKARFIGPRGNFYAIPHPQTGEIVELANVSGLSKLLYSFPLERWKIEKVATALTRRPDLLMLAGTDVRDATKQALAEGNDKANIGTAIHSVTEMIDAETFDWLFCPPGADQFARRYIEAKERYNLKRVRAEFTVYSFEYGYAGTCDGVYTLDGFDGYVIGDLKTGNVYSDVAIQLGAYALAEGGWVQTGDAQGAGEPVDLLDVRKDVALAIRLHEDDCQIVPVDISDIGPVLGGLAAIRGWKARKDVLRAPLGAPKGEDGTSDAGTVRGPERGPDVVGGAAGATEPPAADAAPVAESQPAADAPADSTPDDSTPVDTGAVAGPRTEGLLAADLKARIEQMPAAAKADLAKAWPAGVPTFKRATREHTEPELTAIEAAVRKVEEDHWLPTWQPYTAQDAATVIRKLEGAFPGSAEAVDADAPADRAEVDEAMALLAHLPRASRAAVDEYMRAQGIPSPHGGMFTKAHYALLVESVGAENVRVAEAKAKATKPRKSNQKELIGA